MIVDTTSSHTLSQLRSAVQTNCHISDARFASDYTLCVYLLKMREFYRWESGLAIGETLSNEAVCKWLSEREQYWGSLEDTDFAPIELDGEHIDPFDTDKINEYLLSRGLVYSGGYGNKLKPLFFLGELEQVVDKEGFSVYISTRELARDLTAPPAMSLGDRIFIRRESLRRMLWEKLDEWRWNKPDNAMGRAMRHYDFDTNLHGALDEMTDNEVDALILHEIGEARAGQHLGDDWHVMLQDFPRSRTELMARAVRDHLADALSTLPALLERMHPPSLHFYFANLSGMRKTIYPKLINAYNAWATTGKADPLHNQAASGKQHWLDIARQMLSLHRNDPATSLTSIEALIESNHL